MLSSVALPGQKVFGRCPCHFISGGAGLSSAITLPVQQGKHRAVRRNDGELETADVQEKLCGLQRGAVASVWGAEHLLGISRWQRGNCLVGCRKAEEFGLAFCLEARQQPWEAAATGSPVCWLSGEFLKHCFKGRDSPGSRQ